MISLVNISKSFGGAQALNDINLTIREGEIFGLIGPDGAGKTTLFRIMTSLMAPDHGTATVFGLDTIRDYKKIRNITGYMPGKFSLYQDLTIEENIQFFASVFGTTINKNYEIIKDVYVQIEPFKTRRAGQLSGGMKQKLALCCSLIHHPKLLILDEPTTGVDAVSRKEFWQLLQKLQQKGITIVVSTPYMDEAELCDRISLIQSGTILKTDEPQNISSGFGQKLLEVKSNKTFQLLKDLEEFPSASSAFSFGQSIHFTSNDQDLSIAQLEEYLRQKGHQNLIIREIKPGAEDVFMRLMQGNKMIENYSK